MNSSKDRPVPKPSPAMDLAPKEDHRVRVAREKRGRMRNHLLQSILVVCSGNTLSGPAVIDDVVRHAEVARGTFYKYFDSLDQAIAELGARLADEMTIGIYPVYNVLDSPVMRTATGFQLFLARAVIDPAWGAFVSHIDLLTNESILFDRMSSDIRLGITTGEYKVAMLEASGDLVLGLQTEAIRRIIRGEQKGAYIQAMTGMLLRGLGVPPAKADKIVAQSYKRLCEEAPRSIPWWKPIV
jgi:AcrR family transcriptional regulator